MYVQWAQAPSGYYIAHAVVDNKHYYASGLTPDKLEQNIRNTLYTKERIGFSQVHLEHQKSDTLDTKFCSKMFRSKYLKPKSEAKAPTVLRQGQIMTPPKPQYEHITEVDADTGELIVFELREVARYKMKTTAVTFIKKETTPILNTDELEEETRKIEGDE